MKAVVRPARTSLRVRSSGATPPQPGGEPAPQVTVVIPTHNRAHLVGRAINSVLAQTFQDFELIVVDDGSQDGTAEAVSKIADPRLRLIRLAKNAGQSHAQNVAIGEARGEWVAFLDDDDEWLPRKLELQLARLERETDALTAAAYCWCRVRTGEGLRTPRPRPQPPEGDITVSLLTRGLPLTPSAHMTKRSALLEVGGFDESLRVGQDLDLWLRLSQAGYRFAAVAEPLMIYHREHDVRLSANPVAQLRGFRAVDRRWGRLMRERAGGEYYRRWRRARNRRFRRRHGKLVRRLARSGSRGEALRYARAVAPALPWGWPLVLRALLVVLLGRLPHRVGRTLGRRGRGQA